MESLKSLHYRFPCCRFGLVALLKIYIILVILVQSVFNLMTLFVLDLDSKAILKWALNQYFYKLCELYLMIQNSVISYFLARAVTIGALYIISITICAFI